MDSGRSESFKESTDKLLERRLGFEDSSETEGAGEAEGGQGNLEGSPNVSLRESGELSEL